MGLVGGFFIVFILISCFGLYYKLIIYIIISVNLMVCEIGILFFFVCVGLGVGKGFIEIIINEGGYVWIVYGVIIMLLFLLIVGIIGWYVYKLNYYILIGVLFGVIINLFVLVYFNDLIFCDVLVVGYVIVYLFIMFLCVFIV